MPMKKPFALLLFPSTGFCLAKTGPRRAFSAEDGRHLDKQQGSVKGRAGVRVINKSTGPPSPIGAILLTPPRYGGKNMHTWSQAALREAGRRHSEERPHGGGPLFEAAATRTMRRTGYWTVPEIL